MGLRTSGYGAESGGQPFIRSDFVSHRKGASGGEFMWCGGRGHCGIDVMVEICRVEGLPVKRHQGKGKGGENRCKSDCTDRKRKN